MKLIFTKEEKFIRDILFDLPIDILNIKKLDIDNLIVLSSSELLIPTHVKLKKKLLRFFPNDFCQYIEWIYNENKANNLILIEEINSIEKNFKKNKIFSVSQRSILLKK